LAGKLEPGASLKIGYFAQAHEQLDPAKTVLEELTSHHEMFVSEARDYLAKFLFQGDDVFKLVSSLSGGERGRLALAILALEGANFLLLDEPTNHLDIPAQETLQEVLEQFEGTILLVSHDRYLVDRLATQIWELTDGRLDLFPGPYQEYLAEREKAAQADVAPLASKRANGRQPTAALSNNALQKRAAQLAELEAEISRLEQQLAELGDALQLASVGQPFDKIQALSIEYAAVEQQLEQSVAAWEKLVHEQALA
jgi:ATP-binding cassette, subfamily F, member 3